MLGQGTEMWGLLGLIAASLVENAPGSVRDSLKAEIFRGLPASSIHGYKCARVHVSAQTRVHMHTHTYTTRTKKKP